MKLRDFKLERFFAAHEFEAPFVMCSSDCESFSIQKILALEPGVEGEFRNQWLGYTDSKGSAHLRREIASMYEKIEARQVLVHAGAEEAIFNFFNAILEPGDHIIVESPCYQSLEEVPMAIGAQVSRWSLQENEGRWQLDMKALPGLLKPRTRALIINSPHNPTGHHMTRDEFQHTIDFCQTNKLLLLSDEVYKFLEYSEEQRLPWASDLYENAVSLGVMSKSFGLAGLRIGWIATRNADLYNKMAAIKDYTSICNSAPSEFLARIALRNRRHILERNNKVITGNLKYLRDCMSRNSTILHWNPPQAGPMAFPRLKSNADAGLFAEDLLARKRVLVLPGECYDMPAHFRIGFGRMNFKECLDNFEEYLQEMKK